MTTSIILAMAKVTIVATAALIVGRLRLAKSPTFAARISWIGILLSVVMAATTFCPPTTWFGRPGESSITKIPDEIQSTAPDESLQVGSGSSLFSIRIREGWMARLRMGEFKLPVNDWLNATGLDDSTQLPSPWKWILAFAFSSGIVLGLGWLAIGIRGLRRLRRDSETVKWLCTNQEQQFSKIVRESGLKRIPRLRISPYVNSPCVSWIDSTIFVPDSFFTWTQSEQNAAWAHELAHISRRDPLLRLAAAMSVWLMWLHPVVLILYRQLVLAQELAADEKAAALLGNRSRYRKSLSQLALRADATVVRPVWAFPVSVSSHGMIRRIKMLSITRTPIGFWQGCRESIITCFVVMLSLAAATLSADEPIARVAHVAKLEPDTERAPKLAMAKQFQGPHTQPWEALGDGQGYAMIRFGEIVSNTNQMSQLMRQAFEQGTDDKVSETGLSLDNLSLVRMRLKAEAKLIPPERRKGKETGIFMIESNAFDCQCAAPVDWAKVADLDWSSLGPPETVKYKTATALLRAKGKSDYVRAVTPLTGKVDSNRLQRLKSIWERVDGGSAAMIYVNPYKMFAKFMLEKKDINEEDRRAGELLSSIRLVASGIEFNQDSVAVRMILDILPDADMPSILATTKHFRDTFVDDMTDEAEANDKKDDKEMAARQKWLRDIVQGLDVRVEENADDTESAGQIIIEGVLPAHTLASMF